MVKGPGRRTKKEKCLFNKHTDIVHHQIWDGEERFIGVLKVDKDGITWSKADAKTGAGVRWSWHQLGQPNDEEQIVRPGA